jgi:hypothetical protein
VSQDCQWKVDLYEILCQRRLEEVREICSRLSQRGSKEGFLIWGTVSPQYDSLPRKSFISSPVANVDHSLHPAPDPPPSFPIQEKNNSESLLNQFSGEPQIVTCLTISQLTCDTALPRATGSDATLLVGPPSNSVTVSDNIKGTYVPLSA